jgi:hypothetical protein
MRWWVLRAFYHGDHGVERRVGECDLGEWNGGGWDELRNAILNGISDAGVYTNPSGFQ